MSTHSPGFVLDTRKTAENWLHCCLLSTGEEKEIDKQVDREFKTMIPESFEK